MSSRRSPAEPVAIVKTYGLDAEVLAASARHPRHVTEAALASAHTATVLIGVLRQMVRHPLTDAGIAGFPRDWDPVQNARLGAPA